ncbi:MAG: DMT superfamily drug/metaboltie permease, partial [bacterium]
MKPGPKLTAAVILLLILIWGSTWAVIRVGLVGIPPLTGVALRFGIASLLLFSIGLARGVRFGAGRYEKAIWWSSALLSFSTSYVVVYWAEQYVPSGLAAVLWATFPLILAILAHFMIPGEQIRPVSLVGTLIGFAGIGVIYSEDFALLGGPNVLFASIVLLISPLVSALANVVIKRWGKGVHPISLTAVPMGMT